MAHDTAATLLYDRSAAAVTELPHASAAALDKKLFRGITWTGGIRMATLVLSWASWIVVARILSPADYGLVAMATVFLGVAAMITDFGLGNAIVALRDLEDDVAAQLHTVATCAGIAAVALACAAAVPLSRFFAATALVPVVIVLSIGVALDSLRIVPAAQLARQLRFKHVALLDGSRILVAVAVTVALAASGAGYWALVLGNVLAALAVTIFTLFELPQRFARPDFRRLRPTLTFSSHFLTGQLALYSYMNADFVIAGRVLGRVALGEYTLAWNLTNVLGDKILTIVGRVMPSMLAAVQRDRDALRRYFLLYTEALAVVIVPASVGLCLVTPEFIPLVFGAKWSAAVIPTQLLCIYAAIYVPSIPTMPLLQVTQQAIFPVRFGIIALATLVPLFYFAGSRWGTVGIAGTWVSAFPLLLVPVYTRVFRTIAINTRDFLRTLGPVLASAALMAAVVSATRLVIPAAWPLSVRFSVLVSTGLAALLISGTVLYRQRLARLAEFLRNVRS